MAGKQSGPTTRERLEEMFREIGTLLITFAPLDAALNEHANRTSSMLLFSILGLGLAAGAILSEQRRQRDRF